MQALIHIFDNPSDQARLFTTLIAAVIAIIVVLINQRHNTLRAKKEKLTEKVEETFLAVTKLSELISSVNAEIITNYTKYEDPEMRGFKRLFSNAVLPKGSSTVEVINQEIHQVVAKIHMLAGLYFPSLTESIEELQINYQSMYLDFIQSEELSDYTERSQRSKDNIQTHFDILHEKLTTLMSTHMH